MEADIRDYGMDYQIPVGFITGSCDWTTPVKFAQEYYDAISAPKKQIHLMAGCGHASHYDLPEEFAAIVKTTPDEYLQSFLPQHPGTNPNRSTDILNLD